MEVEKVNAIDFLRQLHQESELLYSDLRETGKSKTAGYYRYYIAGRHGVIRDVTYQVALIGGFTYSKSHRTIEHRSYKEDPALWAVSAINEICGTEFRKSDL